MTQFRSNSPVVKTFDGFLNEIFNDMPAAFGKTVREDVFSFPPVNITEKKDAYYLEVSAPGMDKADFSVKLDGNLLTISAEKKETVKDETEKTIRREFSSRKFKRSFTLDEKVDAANIVAKYENGILKLQLAKKEEIKNAAKEISIL